MPGSIGKNMGPLLSTAKTLPTFPKKGRKAFICPQKNMSPVNEESSPEPARTMPIAKPDQQNELQIGKYDFGSKQKQKEEEEDIF
jgi:hypothetical protein